MPHTGLYSEVAGQVAVHLENIKGPTVVVAGSGVNGRLNRTPGVEVPISDGLNPFGLKKFWALFQGWNCRLILVTSLDVDW